MIRYLLSAIVLLLSIGVASAQSTQQLCYTTNGSNCAQASGASNTLPIAVTSATTVQIVALDANKSIYVSSWDAISSAAGTLQWIYGTGTTCGTGTTSLTGAYAFGASMAFSKGNGIGAIFTVPKGNALCLVSGGSIAAQGSLSYVQF